MTNILCDKRECEYNEHESCKKEHITLCNIKTISQHFWFACFDYSTKDAPQPVIKADAEKVATESATQPEIEFCSTCGTALGCR